MAPGFFFLLNFKIIFSRSEYNKFYFLKTAFAVFRFLPWACIDFDLLINELFYSRIWVAPNWNKWWRHRNLIIFFLCSLENNWWTSDDSLIMLIFFFVFERLSFGPQISTLLSICNFKKNLPINFIWGNIGGHQCVKLTFWEKTTLFHPQIQ